MVRISIAKTRMALLICATVGLLGMAYTFTPSDFSTPYTSNETICLIGMVVYFVSSMVVPRQSQFELLFKFAVLLLCCGLFARLNLLPYVLYLVSDVSISKERSIVVASAFNIIGLLLLAEFWLLHLRLRLRKVTF